MKKIFWSIVSIAGFLTATAQAPNPELKGLINNSFTYFPRFNELNQAVTVSQQRAELAALSNRPTISAAASYAYIAPVPTVSFPDGNGGSKEIKFQPNHNVSTGFTVLEPVFDFGRTRLAVERARLDVQQARNNIEYNKAQLAAQVANIYYTIIYLNKAIALQDSTIAVLEVNRKLEEDKYRNGDALKLDVLTIQNNIDIEQNRKADLQNQLAKQYNLLQYATGQTTAPSAPNFDFSTSITDSVSALKNAQVNNYDYIIAQERIAQAEADVAISQLVNKPTISLNGGPGFRNGFQPDIGQFRFNYSVGVSIAIPIYTGGKDKKQTQIAQSVVKQNQLALQSLDNQYSRDIKQALVDLQTNLERLRTTQNQIDIAKEALRVAESRYRNGLTTNVEFLNATTNLQRIQLAQIQYQYQLTLAQIELARLTGSRYW